MFLTIFESTFTSFLRGLITNDEPQNYEQVAQDWLIALVVIAVVWALVAFAIKWFLKSHTRLPKYKLWGRKKTIAYTLGISLLLGTTVGIVWKSSLDFTFVVGVPGLFKGVFLGAVLYMVLMLIFHLFGDARRDLYD